MKNTEYVLALDQGTTSSRAILIDNDGQVKKAAQQEFRQLFPQSAWVEHDPAEIWESQRLVALKVMSEAGLDASCIRAIGITNQRETTILWDRHTGKPIHNAIVWQDRRTADHCETLRRNGLSDTIQHATGLLPDPYFSATKISWLLENVPEARKKAETGDLAFGTVDSWLIWNLTGGKTHATDVTNASRTMLFNITSMAWDADLLGLFSIPTAIMPEVRSNAEVYGQTDPTLFGSPIPICGVAGDQHAALFGQMCINEGMVKNTYGTGCFIMMNTGNEPVFSKHNLLTTIAWSLNGSTSYALEGSIFIGGAVVQWLRDGLGIIRNAGETESLAKKVPDNGNVYFVPAFTGLGAPYWDPHARGLITGITRGTTSAHIARAALESIAYQTRDVLDAMLADTGTGAKELRVDGGASANNLLMQFQSDILDLDVVRPINLETTAMGAGFLAGIASGFWSGIGQINRLWQREAIFRPELEPAKTSALYEGWKNAVNRAKSWSAADSEEQ